MSNIKVGITNPFSIFALEKKLNTDITFIDVDMLSKKTINSFDLIIFPGGEDINPRLYNQEVRYAVGVNNRRDEHELKIFNEIEKKKKILGICRGHQFINIMYGCGMIQDLNEEMGTFHSGIHSLKRTFSSDLINFTTVNSMHHQAVVHPSLRITSFYSDKLPIVESCENDHIVTVQFHPEFMNGEETNFFWENIIKWVKGEPLKKFYKTELDNDYSNFRQEFKPIEIDITSSTFNDAVRRIRR